MSTSKSGSNPSNLDALLAGATQSGFLSEDATASMNFVDLGAVFNDNLGIDPNLIDSNEVFALFVLIDDSSSIRFAQNTQLVRDGYNGILEALTKSNARDEIIVSTLFLNAGVLQPPVPLAQAMRLDTKNYNPSGGTPLYDQSIALGALGAAKYQECTATGTTFRAVLLLVTDGNDEGSSSVPGQVKSVFDSLQMREVVQVIGFGISDGKTDFDQVFQSMGILPDLALTVKNDPSSIRAAFGVVSRASVSASQGGSVSQSGGLGAFGD